MPRLDAGYKARVIPEDVRSERSDLVDIGGLRRKYRLAKQQLMICFYGDDNAADKGGWRNSLDVNRQWLGMAPPNRATEDVAKRYYDRLCAILWAAFVVRLHGNAVQAVASGGPRVAEMGRRTLLEEKIFTDATETVLVSDSYADALALLAKAETDGLSVTAIQAALI